MHGACRASSRHAHAFARTLLSAWYGPRAGDWQINGARWGMFHLPFGGPVLLLLLPICGLLPWLVQRYRNVWLGVIVHAQVKVTRRMAKPSRIFCQIEHKTW
jgi:hypothetical protein